MDSFPLLFGKKNAYYQIDEVKGNDDLSKHLMDIGFVKDSVLQVCGNNNKGIIINIFGAKMALDFQVAQRIYIREYIHEDIETL